MPTRAASLAKRASEEVLIESSPPKRARNAHCTKLVAPVRHTMQTRSAKRAREEGQTDCSKRMKLADSEEEQSGHALSSSDKEASERFRPAARMPKRPFSQSQAAGDSKAVLQKPNSALQQVGACCFLLLDLWQSMHLDMLIFCA